MIDIHRHFFFGKANIETLLKEMDADHIEKTVLFGYHGLSLLDQPHRQDQEILAFSRQFPDKILPFFCDFDLYDNAPAYIAKCARDGFCGMGEILIGHTPLNRQSFTGCRYCDTACIEAFQAAGAWRLPVLVHVDPAFMEDFLQAVKQCPQTNFILAHIGYNFMGEYGGQPPEPQTVASWLEAYPNLYADISLWKISPIYLMNEVWQKLLETHSDRFILGYDMSENYMDERVWIPAYEQILMNLSETAQNNIRGDVARKLLGRSFP